MPLIQITDDEQAALDRGEDITINKRQTGVMVNVNTGAVYYVTGAREVPARLGFGRGWEAEWKCLRTHGGDSTIGLTGGPTTFESKEYAFTPVKSNNK